MLFTLRALVAGNGRMCPSDAVGTGLRGGGSGKRKLPAGGKGSSSKSKKKQKNAHLDEFGGVVGDADRGLCAGAGAGTGSLPVQVVKRTLKGLDKFLDTLDTYV